jgi:hypothetical protein
VVVEDEQELGVGEERRELVGLLVAEELVDGVAGPVLAAGALALDHGQRDAVDEEHEVEPAGFAAVLRRDLHLGGDVPEVARRLLPIDVAQGKTFPVAGDFLLEALAEHEQVEDAVVGSQQAVVERGGEDVDGGAEVVFGERLGLALEVDRVEPAELGEEDGFEQDAVGPVAARGVQLDRTQVGVAELHEQARRRNLGGVVFEVGGRREAHGADEGGGGGGVRQTCGHTTNLPLGRRTEVGN